MKLPPESRREYLTVFTDVLNPKYSSFWPGDPAYLGKHWVDFTVPTRWLMENLGIKREMDISVKLANYELDKERVLLDAMHDGVVEFGW